MQEYVQKSIRTTLPLRPSGVSGGELSHSSAPDNDGKPSSTALIFETGDEIASVLQQFARGQGLAGSSFKAIGALSYAKLGWFNWATKKYDSACVLDEQVELLSLIGDIALRDGEPQVHAHVVVGRSDGTAHGGHLLEARVRHMRIDFDREFDSSPEEIRP